MTSQAEPEAQAKERPSPEQGLRQWFGPGAALTEISDVDPQLAPAFLCDPGASDLASQWPAGTKLLSAVCGPRTSRSLAALIIRQREAWIPMMEMNPGLFNGLITGWPRARVLWFWVEGAAPRNLNMGPMSWISYGPVPLCAADAVQSSGVSHEGPILNLNFTDIRWDPSTESLIQFDRIEAELGHPFELDGAGRPTLNLLYWSEVLVWQCSLVYDLPQKAFRQGAQGSSRLLSAAEVIQLVTRVLQGMAATVPGFPLAEINLRRIRQLLGLMQVRAAVEPVAEKAVVDRFLTESIQPCPGGRLLSEELRGAFALSCRAKGLPLCSEDLFFKVVSKKLGPSSHCFGENASKRGRVGWKLNWDVVHSGPVKDCP